MENTFSTGSLQDKEIAYLMSLSEKQAVKKEEMYGTNFSQEEIEFMVREYMGDSNSSYYTKTKDEYLNKVEPFIRLSDYKSVGNQMIILSAVVNTLKKTIGLKGLDIIFGNNARWEVISIAEDAFLRVLNTYNVPETLHYEIEQKLKDDSYKLKRKAFTQFNSYLSTSIRRDVRNYIKVPGEYEKHKTVTEKYYVYDENNEKQEVVETRKVKGNYIPDSSRKPPLPFNLADFEGDFDDEYGEKDTFIAESNLDIDTTFGSYTTSFYDPVEKLNNDHIREIIVKIYNSLSDKEKMSLRNSEEFCNVFGLEKFTQEEISKIVNLSQGTVSRICKDATFKMAAKVLREGYDFEERIFK